MPAALAAKGDPQKKITKDGQARAKAAALRLSYFPPGRGVPLALEQSLVSKLARAAQ